MRRRGYLAGWTATVLLSPAVASAQSIEIHGPPAPTGREVVSWDAEGRATVRATRALESMSIDGVLDEPFYRSTASIPNLKQSLPTPGAEPAERTETWIGFDDNNIYVAARLWDSAPETEWTANEMRRDASTIRTNDNFGVFLDTYYDRRNSIGLYVTPVGGFTDLQMTKEGSPNFDSGLFFPVDRLPSPLQVVAQGLPTTHAVSLMQGVWDGSGWGAHWGSVVGLILVFGVCTGLSTKVFRWE